MVCRAVGGRVYVVQNHFLNWVLVYLKIPPLLALSLTSELVASFSQLMPECGVGVSRRSLAMGLGLMEYLNNCFSGISVPSIR